MLKEMMYVLFQMKGVKDAYAVSTGVEQHEDALIDPLNEMMYSKGAEMFAESIPSALVQCLFLIRSDIMPTSILGSVLISSLATGFASASMSFDADTSPENRKSKPAIYGMAPDTGRGFYFAVTLLMAASLNLAKTLGVCYLISLRPVYGGASIVGDILFFFLYKACRGDIRFFLRLSGSASWISTIIIRTNMKTMTDYTGWLHGRHPYSLGGMYFMVNLAITQVMSFVGALAYNHVGEGARSPTEVLCSIGIPCVVFNICFVIFMLLIKKEYRHTFFNPMTGKEFACNCFRDAKTDEEKFGIFGNHPSYFESINGDLKLWLAERWPVWMEENPAWLTTAAKKRIPLELAPRELITQLNREHNVLLDMGEVVRTSLRRLSYGGFGAGAPVAGNAVGAGLEIGRGDAN